MPVGAYYRLTTRRGQGQEVASRLLSDFGTGGIKVTRAEVFDDAYRSGVVHADVEALEPGDMSVFSLVAAQLSGVTAVDVFPRF